MFAAFNCVKIIITYKECHQLIQFITNSITSHKKPVQLLSMVARFSTSRSSHTLPKMASEI